MLRRMIKEDQEEIVRLYRGYIEPSFTEEEMGWQLGNGVSLTQTYVLSDGEKIIGAITWDKRRAQEVELSWLAVIPEYRKNGVAISLIKESLPFLEKWGVRYILIETSKDNTASQELYRKAFSPVSEWDAGPQIFFYKNLKSRGAT